MLQFLQPVFWIAFAGMLIPVAIHLWNRREGRTIKVGSIELLQVAEEKRLSSIKFSDLWRLLLRMSILASFVFLLMAPYWESSNHTTESAKWALIGPSYLDHPSLPLFTDSLKQNGFELRLFSQDFPLLENVAKTNSAENYWSLLTDLNELPASPDSLFILAHPSSQHFQGQRPAFNIPLEWKSMPLTSSDFFVAKAWRESDELILLVGQSDSEGTIFQRQGMAFNNEGGEFKLSNLPKLNIQKNINKNTWEVAFLDQPENVVPILDSFQMQINILYDSGFELDKQYLEAALRAVEKYLDLSLTVQIQKIDNHLSTKKDWLFWLSEKELPDTLKTKFSPHLAIFQPGIRPQQSSFVKAEHQYDLVKRLDNLEAELNSSWLLPHELIRMLFEDAINGQALYNEQRTLSISQILPDVASDTSISNTETNKQLKTLFFPVWLIILILFALERLIGFRKRQNLA